MKLRNYKVLLVFVLFVTFLLFRPSAIGQTESRELQTIEEIKNLIEIKGPTVEDPDGTKVRKLAEKIHADFQNLSRLFEAGEKGFEREMINILGKKTSIKTSEGEIFRYPETKKYFNDKRNVDKYDRVEFELNAAYVFYEEENPLIGKKCDYLAYKLFTIHLIRQNRGEIIENQNDEGEGSDKHTHGCDWFGR